MPHIRHPKPWDQQCRDRPSECLALETSGDQVQETQRLQGAKALLIKGCSWTCLLQRPARKQQFESRQTTQEGYSFVNLKVAARGAGTYWDSPQDRGRARAISALSFCLNGTRPPRPPRGPSLIAWLWWLGRLPFLGPTGL